MLTRCGGSVTVPALDIESARALKTWIRRRSGGRFAVGIGVAGAVAPPGTVAPEYRVVILVQGAIELSFAHTMGKAGGNDIDVEVVGTPRAAASIDVARTRPARPLSLGASVGHARGVGSLGFFAERRFDGARGFVSCNHVIAGTNRGRHGDAVTSPAPVDGDAMVVARLDGSYPRLADRSPADCAFAVLDDGVMHDVSSVAGGSLRLERPEVIAGLQVTKIGRITGARAGIVTRVEVDDVRVRYDRYLQTSFDGVLVIESSCEQPFCSHGDSGALVYTAHTLQPVGLLFATSYVGGAHNAGRTWVHPVSRVQDALGVMLVTR